MKDWIRLSCDRCGAPNHLYEPDIPDGPESREIIRFCPKCRRERERASK